MNIATNKITLLSMKPEKAELISRTPVTTRPIQTIIEVTPSGIFSSTNITTANRRKSKVIVDGLIFSPPNIFFSKISLIQAEHMSNKMADLLLSCCKLIITTLFLLVHLQKMILA